MWLCSETGGGGPQTSRRAAAGWDRPGSGAPPSTRPGCTWATRPPRERKVGRGASQTRGDPRFPACPWACSRAPHAAALGPGWLLLLGCGLPCGRLQLVTGLWGGLCPLRPPGLPRELGRDAVRFASLHKSRLESRARSLLRARRQAHGLGFHVRGKISTSRPRFRISFSFSGEDGTECVFMIYQ